MNKLPEIWRIKTMDGRIKDVEIDPDDPTEVHYLLKTLRREAAINVNVHNNEIRLQYFMPKQTS